MRALRYTAAGVVIVDGDRVLVLRRPARNEVRLPKGHVEANESAPEAALREAEEESGYADLEIVADLGYQRVEFDYQGAHVVRDERYFAVRLRGGQVARRKERESQFIPTWLGWEQALSELTFEAEREWVRRARQATMPGTGPSPPAGV